MTDIPRARSYQQILEEKIDQLEEKLSDLETNMGHIAGAVVAIVTLARGKDSPSGLAAEKVTKDYEIMSAMSPEERIAHWDGESGEQSAEAERNRIRPKIVKSGELTVELDEDTFDGLDGFTGPTIDPGSEED